jgi:mono/diheme cytochrome c family protein
MKKWLKIIGIALIVLLIAAQFVPVSRANPPISREVKWDTPATRALAQRACFDCHSNETTWVWFDYVAPASWYVAHHIDDGRRALNFSAWDQPNSDFEEISRSIKNGEMPLWDYLLLHPNAKLTAAEQAVLLNGLQATFQQDPPIPRPRRSREGD